MSFDMPSLPDIIGLIGVLIILIAYGLLTLEKIDPKGWRYSAYNGVGAGLILISLFYSFNPPAL